jgi:flagellar hook-length control protein FliK
MSQVKLDNVAGLVPMETVLSDPGRVRSGVPASGWVGSESFRDCFWRLQALSKEISAGGELDSARLKQPEAAPAHSPHEPAGQKEPAADHGRGSLGDSAGVPSDEKAPERVSPETSSRNDRGETAEAEQGGTESQPPEAAETGWQPQHEQTADADSEVNKAKQVDSHRVPGKPSPKHRDGQVHKGHAAQAASDPTSTSQEGKGKEVRPHVTQEGKGEEADPQAGTPAAQTATMQPAGQQSPQVGGVSGKSPAVRNNLALEHAEQAQKALGPKGGSRKPEAGKQKAEGGKTDSGRSLDASPVRLPPSAASLRKAAGAQASRQAQQQPAENPKHTVVALGAGADAQTILDRPRTSDDERVRLGGDPKAHAAEETAKPATPVVADSRLGAPVRTTSGPEPRAAAAPQPHEASQSVHVDQARLVQRVARAFRTVSKDGGSIRLRLSPPELGSVRLEIAVRHGAMTARVEAETTTARNLLLDNLPALRDRLAQQDVKIKQFDVGLMDQSPGGLPHQTADQTTSHYRGATGNAPPPSGGGDRDPQPTSPRAMVNRPGEGTRLNVVI